MEKIGIYGGTFNPVHSEHINVTEQAIRELNLDRLFVVPTFSPPHKTTSTDAKFRYEMACIAFSKNQKITVSDYEITKGGKSYTFETILYFRSIYPNAELFFICGADMLKDFKTWKNPDIILGSANLAVFDREGSDVDFDKEREYLKEKYGKEFIKLNYVGKEISSTKIRVYSAFGLDISKYTCKEVADYITKTKLYADKYADYVKGVLTEKRLIHTANVVVCALRKAKELGLDEYKVFVSATLHDNAKYIDYKAVEGFVLPEGVPDKVVHSFLGAYIAEKTIGVKDEEILDAIRFHTSGKANMSTLGKLIFVADMVEEGRVYQGVEHLRELYEKDFNECFIECLKEETAHLIRRGGDIYVETMNAYNYYVKGENK